MNERLRYILDSKQDRANEDLRELRDQIRSSPTALDRIESVQDIVDGRFGDANKRLDRVLDNNELQTDTVNDENEEQEAATQSLNTMDGDDSENRGAEIFVNKHSMQIAIANFLGFNPRYFYPRTVPWQQMVIYS